MTEPNVSVCILIEKKIKFELYGDYAADGFDKIFSGEFTAIADENGKISIDSDKSSFTVEHDIIFANSDPDADSFLIKDVVIGIQFHWEKKEKQRFTGSLQLLREGDEIYAINIVPVENYLTSVISSEMNANSSVEFLKAHSIISRSWLLAQIEKRSEISSAKKSYLSHFDSSGEHIKWYDREDHVLFDVCADDHCQRYQGITKLFAHNAQIAVNETRGLILEYENKICDTRFSKSCGGIAESFENVWEDVKHPYLSKIIDYKFEPEDYDLNLKNENAAEKWILSSPPAFCNTKDQKILSQVLQDYDLTTTDFYRWEVVYTQKEIQEILLSKSGFDFGEIISLTPIERGDSGRLIKLKINGTKKTLVVGKELEIRKFLSRSHLYSSCFMVKTEEIENGIPGKFILSGAGWGHGVGLCQIGAAVMSDMGFQFDEILLHYFRGAKINKIY